MYFNIDNIPVVILNGASKLHPKNKNCPNCISYFKRVCSNCTSI